MLKKTRWLGALLLALTFIATPALASAQTFFDISFGSAGFGSGLFVDFAPPALPDYAQPPCPGSNFIWMPGYWAWGDGGYYWVPGTWVEAPQIGLYWTPGYWAWNGDYDAYAWSPGYWAPEVGFYGGIDYGFGYYGNGYVGGRWYGDGFRYNTAVTNVNVTIVHNVYVDRSVAENNYDRDRYNRVSFDGGTDGIQARPTQRELAVLNDRRFPMTSAQTQHVQMAAQDRNLLATVNHGSPGIVTVRRPFTQDRRPANFAPIRQQDRATADTHVRNTQIQNVRVPQQVQEYRMPQQQQVQQYRAPAVQQYRMPQQQQVQQYRAPAVQQYRMPQQQQVQQYRAPAVQQYRMPQQQQVQQYRAPAVQQYRMPQQQAQRYQPRPSRTPPAR